MRSLKNLHLGPLIEAEMGKPEPCVCEWTVIKMLICKSVVLNVECISSWNNTMVAMFPNNRNELSAQITKKSNKM